MIRSRVRKMMIARSLRCWLVAVLMVAGPLHAQAGDSIPAEPLFGTRDAVFFGGVALGTVVLAPLDVSLARLSQEERPQRSPVLRAGATGLRLLGFPGTVFVGAGLFAAGHLADSYRLADIGLHTTEAFVLSQAIIQVGKLGAGRARPLVDVDNSLNFRAGRGWGDDDYRSFPSGHSSAAFATAAALSTELTRIHPEARWLVRVPLYGAAGLVGVSRMYHNKHWATDVLMGAAIGSWSAWKVVDYNHAHPRNRVNRWLLGTTVVPLEDGVLVQFSAPTRR